MRKTVHFTVSESLITGTFLSISLLQLNFHLVTVVPHEREVSLLLLFFV